MLWKVTDDAGRVLGEFNSLEAAERFAALQIGRSGAIVLDDYARECKGTGEEPGKTSSPSVAGGG